MIDYFHILHQIIDPSTSLYRFYLPHAVLVTCKALQIARCARVMPDELRFIEEAAMLHDIGIVAVAAPEIGSFSDQPYIRHGVEGRAILEDAGLPAHALVCERHVGVGLSREEIRDQKLPLPDRDMIPQSRAEEIVCLADLFFSKSPQKLWREKTLKKIRKTVRSYGPRQSRVLEDWIRTYHLEEMCRTTFFECP
ncbi:phosphohydrolase [candidate division KSB1 bacterium]|nr:phosphohydrolase [candidate division KSB1 bacterium]